jgi:allophanate hydrolase
MTQDGSSRGSSADLDVSIASLRSAYLLGKNPSEVVHSVYQLIDATADPGIFIHLRPIADVLAEATALAARDPAALPLYGVPFAVKDNIDVAGLPTTAACPGYSSIASETAPAVAALIAAGALLIGKTNLDQFATGLVGVRSPYPIPKNAIDPTLVPGGSSSGSAVAVARGIVTFALGTDTAGSGRIPAGLNRIVGLKPSVGAVSTRGVVPACRTLDCVSVFAGSVDDAFTATKVMAVADPRSRGARGFSCGS